MTLKRLRNKAESIDQNLKFEEVRVDDQLNRQQILRKVQNVNFKIDEIQSRQSHLQKDSSHKKR